jgi:hypothetical protein
LPVQSTQAVDDPHDVSVVPAWHMAIVPPQQKPVPHAPPSQLAVHDPPAQVGVAPPQLWHMAPVEPQAAFMFPVTHFAPSQQPPVQTSPPAQLAPHVPVVVLQASPAGHDPGVQGGGASCPASCPPSSPASCPASLPTPTRRSSP